MEALRNYAQHVAFPVQGWTVEQSWDDSTKPSLLKARISPGLDLAALSASGKFKKTVLDELQEKIAPNELRKKAKPTPLKPIIREYIEELGTVHSELRAATNSCVSEATARIRGAVVRFVEKFPGSEIPVVALPVDEAGIKTGDPVYLSATVMKYLPHLQSRIGSLINFSRRRVEY